MPTRLVRRPIAALLTGLVALSLAACGGGDTANLIGTLDKSFGKSNDGTPDGMVSYSIGTGNDTTRGTVIQADGKILVVGTSTSTGGASSNIVVERFNADGTIDTTFGADGNSDGSPDGVVSLDLGAGSDEGRAIAVQADGKIVVVGTHVDGTKNIVVVRLTAAGALDATFGVGGADGNGVFTLDLGPNDDIANAVALQHDGKILIAGTTGVVGDTNAVVARLNTDGSLDINFGDDHDSNTFPDGYKILDLTTSGTSSEEAVAIAVQGDDRIVIAGNSNASGTSNVMVARLNPNGQLDTFFGTDSSDGTPAGVVSVNLSTNDNDVASALALQADGKILVAGKTGPVGNTNATVARLNADGEIDASFGAGTNDGTPDGSVAVSLGNGSDEIAAIAVDADGKIVVVGTTTSTGTTSNVFVARLLPGTGGLDTAFGQGNDGTPDGVVNLSFGDGNDFGRALALQADGKIVVAGDSIGTDSTSNIVLARLLVKN